MQPVTRETVQGWLGREAMSIVSVAPFSLRSPRENTLSLLILVWNGGLQKEAVAKLAASLQKEERLHLRLATLTRSTGQSAWVDDPSAQRELLEAAAKAASSAPADQPGYVSKTSDEHVLEDRWKKQLRLSVEDTIAQPGKQAVLELLPRPPLRPPIGPEHWRISNDRDSIGEPQVHTIATLDLVPVYRVHNDTPALAMVIPGGDASTPTALGGGGAAGGQAQLAQVRNAPMPPLLPPDSRLFSDLGGRDVFEAYEALPYILADMGRTYTVVVKTPAGCTPRGIVPLRLSLAPANLRFPTSISAPHWALFSLLGKSSPYDSSSP